MKERVSRGMRRQDGQTCLLGRFPRQYFLLNGRKAEYWTSKRLYLVRLHDFEFRKVLNIDKTREFAVVRRDEDIIYLSFFQEFHDFNGHGIFVDGDGILRHDGFDGRVDDGRIRGDASAEIAVRENAEEVVVVIDDCDGAAAGGGHGKEGVSD